MRALAHPGIEPRLVIGESGRRPLTLAEERAAGTYLPVDAPEVMTELRRACLRGRGGAGFPAHVKWQAVADAPGPKVVVANGEEGEPSSGKDRWLLTHRPHAVIDGLLTAADAVGAERALLYLSHPDMIASAATALTELAGSADLAASAGRVEVHTVAHRYVAGEESAVCRSISGGPALPAAKPPRVSEAGVDGRPTLVSNVETLAHAAWIARHGAASYRRYGTERSPGTALATFGGQCGRPGVYEVPYGPTLRELLDACAGGFAAGTPGLLMGGWFGGIAGSEVLDVRWCYDELREAGSCLGCAAVTVLSPAEPIAGVAARLAAWYAAESAGQCGVCAKGTAAIAGALGRLRDGATGTADATEADLRNLARWGTGLRGRGACAFLDGAANVARSVIELRGSRPVPDHVASS